MQPTKISPATLGKLAKLGIHHRTDLLLHLPLRYEDETRLAPISAVQPGMNAQVQGVITHSEVAFRPRRTLVCRLQDNSGELYLRFLNFYPSQQKQLAEGRQIRAVGEVRMGYYGLEMVHPKCRAVDDDTPLQQSLTPVYPTTAGLSQAVLRKLIANALDTLPLDDTLPDALLQKMKLAGFADSVRLLHNPRRTFWRPALNSVAMPHGGASNSTSCWRSNCRCACTTASAASAPRPGLHRSTGSPHS